MAPWKPTQKPDGTISMKQRVRITCGLSVVKVRFLSPHRPHLPVSHRFIPPPFLPTSTAGVGVVPITKLTNGVKTEQ